MKEPLSPGSSNCFFCILVRVQNGVSDRILQGVGVTSVFVAYVEGLEQVVCLLAAKAHFRLMFLREMSGSEECGGLMRRPDGPGERQT